MKKVDFIKRLSQKLIDINIYSSSFERSNGDVFMFIQTDASLLIHFPVTSGDIHVEVIREYTWDNSDDLFDYLKTKYHDMDKSPLNIKLELDDDCNCKATVTTSLAGTIEPKSKYDIFIDRICEYVREELRN